MRFLRHPIHPLLVHFPIAFWSLATACDGVVQLGSTQASSFAWMLLALGSTAAVPAIMAGFVDLARLSSAAEADGQRHMMLMGLAWMLYASALFTRLESGVPLAIAPFVSVALSFAGFTTMAVGGWYGGQLVYHHHAGADEVVAHDLSQHEKNKESVS